MFGLGDGIFNLFEPVVEPRQRILQGGQFFVKDFQLLLCIFVLVFGFFGQRHILIEGVLQLGDLNLVDRTRCTVNRIRNLLLVLFYQVLNTSFTLL